VEKVKVRPRLWSALTGCSDLPRVQTSVGQRIFAFHGPTAWNCLPSAPRDSSLSVNTFQRRLKTQICLDSHERHPALLWRFTAILVPDINVMIYLLTYWLTYLLSYLLTCGRRLKTYLFGHWWIPFRTRLGATDGHPCDYWPGPTWSNFVDGDQHAKSPPIHSVSFVKISPPICYFRTRCKAPSATVSLVTVAWSRRLGSSVTTGTPRPHVGVLNARSSQLGRKAAAVINQCLKSFQFSYGNVQSQTLKY